MKDGERTVTEVDRWGVTRVVGGHVTVKLQPDPLCDKCNHPEAHHGRKGCEAERGDQLVGEMLQAMGPCTCRETFGHAN